MKCLLELNSNPPSWVDGSQGDPGRTTRRECAKRYNYRAAMRAVARFRYLYGRNITVRRDSEA